MSYFNIVTYFRSPYFGGGGGGGGHGSGHGAGHGHGYWRKRQGFGSYVDEIIREQLKSERKVDPPKPKWIRHHDD